MRTSSFLAFLLGLCLQTCCPRGHGPAPVTRDEPPIDSGSALRIGLDHYADIQGDVLVLFVTVTGREALARDVASTLFLELTSPEGPGRNLEAQTKDHEPIGLLGIREPHRSEVNGALVTSHSYIAPIPTRQSGGTVTLSQPIHLRVVDRPPTDVAYVRLRPAVAALQQTFRVVMDPPDLTLGVDTEWQRVAR